MKKFWNQLKPQERRWVAGIGMVVFVILNYLLVWPQFKGWGNNVRRMNTARANLTTYRAEIAHENEYKNKIREFDADGLAVPAEDQAVHFENFYSDRALENNVAIQTRSPLSTRTNDYFLEKQLAIQVQAYETNLVEFLYSLGASNSMMRVQNMTLRPIEPNRYQLSASLTLVASYQKKSLGPPPATARPAPTTAKPAAPPAKSPVPATPAATPSRLPTNSSKIPAPFRPGTTSTNKPGLPMTKNL